jgi:putative addiction module component (TIGR02574 family)
MRTPSIDLARLSVAERLLLARNLIDSVLCESMPLTDAQLGEIERRIHAIDSGDSRCEDWEVVRAPLSRST